jgi:uncharacterized membrane protein
LGVRGEDRRALGLAAFIGGAGVMHFVRPSFFDAIVPRWVPGSPRTTTYLSGVAELAGAALVAHPRTRRLGARWCFWTFLGVYPANIQHVLDGGIPGQEGVAGSAVAAWIRLPLQIPMFLWARRVEREATPA